MNMTELLSVYNGTAALFQSEINGLMQLSTAYSVSGGNDSAFIPMPSIGSPGLTYTPSILAGINARTSQQALAEAFIALLLSPEVLEVDQMNGLPTTIVALDTLFAEAIERASGTGGFFSARMMISGGATLDVSEPNEDVWNRVRALCETLTIPSAPDETLMAFIIEETKTFFEGQVSAAAAASALERRAWFYLNE